MNFWRTQHAEGLHHAFSFRVLSCPSGTCSPAGPASQYCCPCLGQPSLTHRTDLVASGHAAGCPEADLARSIASRRSACIPKVSDKRLDGFAALLAFAPICLVVTLTRTWSCNSWLGRCLGANVSINSSANDQSISVPLKRLPGSWILLYPSVTL